MWLRRCVAAVRIRVFAFNFMSARLTWQEWDTALHCTAALVERMRAGLSTFLPGGTAACIPFSLYVLRWAKLLHLRGRCKEASMAFEEAIRLLSVALGHEHKLVRNARAQQAEAHAEATS
jgi:hypothetical protein